MIGISKLYCGTVEPSDALRYGRHSGKLPSHLLQFAEDKKPVVVWNMTKACNLKCRHCYAQATAGPADNELSTTEAKAMIDDLAQFGAPVILFSGGEPLVRPDLPELARYAVSKGMRAVISTNGTLITKDVAKELKDIGLSYVGVSLDGMPEVHDKFRGVDGAFDQAMAGIRNCMEQGIKTGLRFTVYQNNVDQVPGVFDILEKEGIPPRLFLSPGVRGPWLQPAERRPEPPGHQGSPGPNHGPHKGAVRQGPLPGGAHRGQPRRWAVCVSAAFARGPGARRKGAGAFKVERG